MAIRNLRIQEILKRYSVLQSQNEADLLTEAQKQSLVAELKKVYDSMPVVEKCDVLVPANWQFIADHAICYDEVSSGVTVYDLLYKWPPNDGFVGQPSKSTLSMDEEYDRIGSAKGKYLAPISETGKPASYLERALPYYIPEENICDSPSYHRYRVRLVYSGEDSRDKNVLQGIVAHAFWNNPDDGGGIQIKLPKSINKLRGVLYEISCS